MGNGFSDASWDGEGRERKPLSKSTLRAILATMREFTIWLSQQDGFRSRTRTADADYFKLSRRDEAEARASPPRAAPGIKQAKRAGLDASHDAARKTRQGDLCAALSDGRVRGGADFLAD